MIRYVRRLAIGIALSAAMISPAGAAIVTALDAKTAVAIPFVSDDADAATLKGPIRFGGGITYSSTRANSLFGYTGSYGFAPGVMWENGGPMIGLNAASGTVTLDFATPIAGFLAEINSTQYVSSADAIITALDAAGNQLDRIVLERGGYRVQPGYMGFSYTGAVISRITFANEYIGFRNMSVVAASAVPEPATWAMMILGMGMVGTRCRRRRHVRLQPA